MNYQPRIADILTVIFTLNRNDFEIKNSCKSTVLFEWNQLIQGQLRRTTGTLNSRPCRRAMTGNEIFSEL